MRGFGDVVLTITSTISSLITGGGQLAQAKRQSVTRHRLERKRAALEEKLQRQETLTRQEEATLKALAAQEQEQAVRKIFVIAGGGLLALAGIITVGVIMIQNKQRGKK